MALNTSTMAGKPWALIVEGGTGAVSERSLGDEEAGTLLPKTVTVLSNVVGDSDGVHLEVLANHRADDDLEGRNLGRHDEAVLITVHTNDGAEQTLRHAVGCLVTEGLFGIKVFVGYVERFGPLVTVVMT